MLRASLEAKVKRRSLAKAVASVVVAVCAAIACTSNQPEAGTTTCSAGQRFLNGTCMQSCAHTADCSPGARCFLIDQAGGVCFAADAGDFTCVYLGDDTKCVGVGIDNLYGGYELPYSSDPPYSDTTNTTTFVDPSFSSASAYYYESPGCLGDAKWVTFLPSGDPLCGSAHRVRRCRVTGTGQWHDEHACVLVDGSTLDRPNL